MVVSKTAGSAVYPAYDLIYIGSSATPGAASRWASQNGYFQPQGNQQWRYTGWTALNMRDREVVIINLLMI